MSNFFQDGSDPVKPMHNISEGTFCLSAWMDTRVALDLTKLLLPFSTCAGLCASWLHTPNNTKYPICKNTQNSLNSWNIRKWDFRITGNSPFIGPTLSVLKQSVQRDVFDFLSYSWPILFTSVLYCLSWSSDTEIQTCARRAVTDLCLESAQLPVSCSTYKDSKIKLILLI